MPEISQLPAELSLAAACCRWPPSPERDEVVAAAADRHLDWARFLRVVDHHRVAPLANHGLRTAGVALPATVDARLADAAGPAARRALGRASETLRLQRAFDAARLPVVFVKGATLEMLAYDQLGLKESWDIDLLTAADNVVEARSVLEGLGYRLADPWLVPADRFARLIPLSKEVIFHHAERQSWVELHWRMMDNPAMIPAVGLRSPTQDVPLGGQFARTLRDEPLYAYLCAHGALHGWSRLKWLADLSAFVATRTATDAAGLHEAAAAFGATRMSGFGLLLSHRVLGLQLPAGLREALERDRGVRLLTDNCMASLRYRAGEPVEGSYSVPALRGRAALLFLAPDRQYFLHQARLTWRSEHDRLRLALPRGAGFLYHLVRIPLWLWRWGGRTRRRPVP